MPSNAERARALDGHEDAHQASLGTGGRAHPLALRLYYELRTMSLPDRVRALRACEERLPREPDSDRHEFCRRAADRCRQDLGRAMSKSEYARWYREHPDKDQLPSDTQVANAFGGWLAVRDYLGETVQADVLARRLTATGPLKARRPVHRNRHGAHPSGLKATQEDAIALLQEWARQHPTGNLSQEPVLEWARRIRDCPTSPPGAVPTSAGAFLRLFPDGGWAEAVEAAGLTHRRPARGTHWLHMQPGHDVDLMQAQLHRAAKDLGPTMTEPRFLHWLDYPPPHEALERLTHPVVGMKALRRVFGSWLGALVATGVISPDDATRRRLSSAHTEEYMLWHVAEAMRLHGPALNQHAYDVYRRRLQSDAAHLVRVPSRGTLLKYFGGPEGSWQCVLDRAQEAAPLVEARVARDPADAGIGASGSFKMNRSAVLVRGGDTATADGQFVARLIADGHAFPEQAVHDLYRLLKHDIASPSTARERFDQLGLLMELLFDGNGVYPSTTRYADLWERRKDEGWPDYSKLSRDYGTWQRAVMAAFRFYFVGGQARVPASYRHVPRRGEPARYGRYSVEDVLHALERFHLDHGVWPTKWEYEDWSHLRRTIERDDPRLPTLPRIHGLRGLFDSFDDAVGAAQRRVEQRGA